MTGPVIDARPSDLGAADLLRAYEARTLSPIDTVLDCIRRIDECQPAINAVLTLVAEQALADASYSERRWAEGTARPLEGVPYGLKDIVETAGIRTTGGSLLFDDHRPTASATVHDRLDAAGAVLLAKLATSEFAAGQPANRRFGPVRNPWDNERWTGGSSTGSGGALASRMVPMAVGTDTGGSIRIPSAWCGTTGLKPTYGRVPRTGVMPLSWTLDHVGPMTRSAHDCALMLATMAGHDPADPTSSVRAVDPSPGHRDAVDPAAVLSGLRIGVPTNWFTDICDDEVSGAWQASLAVLVANGALLVDVSFPHIAPAFSAGWDVLYAEAASLHEPNMEQAALYDPGFVARMAQGCALSAHDYLKALRVRHLLQRDFAEALEQVDVVITIGCPGTAPRLDDLTVSINGTAMPMHQVHSRATMPSNMTGLPALMLPSGRSSTAMPTAMQIIGRPFADAHVLRIGAAFQSLTDHHLHAPAVPSPSA